MISLKLYAYDFSFQKDNISIDIDFDYGKVKEIKFDIDINGQRNFGLINYHNDEIYIILNTDKISFNNFKKIFPKPQKNKKLTKKLISTGKFLK